jgi:HlyD family secretion protein
MKRRTLLTAAGLALVAAGLLAWAFAPRPIQVEVARADTGRFEQSLDEDGRTRLRERYVVSAPLAGRLARITLREGDRVEAGTVVATLSPGLSPMLDERARAAQQARVEAAEAALKRAGVQLDRAGIALEQARGELARTEQLARRGFVAPTRLDAERLGVAAAQKAVDAAVQDRHVVEHELEQARAALGALRNGPAGRPFEVRAPIAGRVLRVAQDSETVVALGAPLLELGDTTRLEVVAELLTGDALRTRPGDPVSIERWGGPGALSGVVARIEPAAFTKVSALGVEEQRVRVLIDLTSPPQAWAALGDGYRVTVRIVVQSVDDALRVPIGAVFPLPRAAADEASPPRWAAWTLRDGRARRVDLDLGGRNAVHAWIRAGLRAGDTVIVYPPPGVTEGIRVSPRGG